MMSDGEKAVVDTLALLVKQMEGINDKLNYLCTQGIFVSIDDDISEN